jgi:predicted nuclease of predicted toxin-antitoxin system
VKLLFDESLSPKLVDLLHDLFPESERAVPLETALYALAIAKS